MSVSSIDHCKDALYWINNQTFSFVLVYNFDQPRLTMNWVFVPGADLHLSTHMSIPM